MNLIKICLDNFSQNQKINFKIVLCMNEYEF